MEFQPHPDLIDKLQRLITPPGAGSVPTITPGFRDLPDKLPGALVVGELSPKEWAVLARALLPGAHVALCAGDIGDAAACAAEESGLEVRDAVFVAQSSQDLIFAAKASRREREEGLSALPARAGHEAVKRKEGSAGLKNARAGAGRSAKEVRNHHPTCKPVSIMAAVIARARVQRGPVVDPFAGTGTTAVACVRIGIPSISIEKCPDYAPVGRARVQHELHRRPG